MKLAKVLIVGAGPTGLTAAVELARQGLVPRVIDRKPEPSTLSRAVGVLPRSLKILEPSGVAARLENAGVRMQRTNLYFDDRHALSLSLRQGHPERDYIIALAQDRTEEVLRDALVSHGGRVDYGCEFTGLEQEGERVVVRMNDGEECAFDLVFGADGVRSAVRQSVQIEFPGFELSQKWSIADVDAEGWRHPSEFTVCSLDAGRIVVVAPLEPTRYRVVSNTDDALRTLPLPLAVTNVRREGQFNIAIRQVDAYRKDRVFLGGDAAHCHSPAGGRGMNLGIADAADFARCVLTDRLDDYHAGRHAHGKETIAASERIRQTLGSSGLRRSLLALGARMLNRLPPLQRFFAQGVLDS